MAFRFEMSETEKNSNDRLVGDVFETVEVSRVLSTPFDESILNLLRVSARSIGAEGASVLLPEGSEGDLKFVWAIGQVADSLIGVSIPSGKGIAGFVFSTGQPMAVSDAGSETSFYAEVDRNTGFSTHSILATPLQFEGEITGVLEYVNRKGEPPYNPFTAEEMDLAALHAEAVASMVHAQQASALLGSVIERSISEGGSVDRARATEIAAEMRASESHRDLIDLTFLLREVSKLGDREKRLCREILESVLKLSRE